MEGPIAALIIGFRRPWLSTRVASRNSAARNRESPVMDITFNFNLEHALTNSKRTRLSSGHVDRNRYQTNG
jgi:hypothetical protein